MLASVSFEGQGGVAWPRKGCGWTLLVMMNSVEDTSCTTGEIDPENTAQSMQK